MQKHTGDLSDAVEPIPQHKRIICPLRITSCPPRWQTLMHDDVTRKASMANFSSLTGCSLSLLCWPDTFLLQQHNLDTMDHCGMSNIVKHASSNQQKSHEMKHWKKDHLKSLYSHQIFWEKCEWNLDCKVWDRQVYKTLYCGIICGSSDMEIIKSPSHTILGISIISVAASSNTILRHPAWGGQVG